MQPRPHQLQYLERPRPALYASLGAPADAFPASAAAAALSSASACSIAIHPALPSRLAFVFSFALINLSNLALSCISSYFPFPPNGVGGSGEEVEPSIANNGDPGGLSVFRNSSISPSSASSVSRRSRRATSLIKEVREVLVVKPMCWNLIGWAVSSQCMQHELGVGRR